MLVLTRKVGEGITIGEEVKIVVIEIRGTQVRLGIEAPKNVIVHREEIFKKIKDATVESAEAPRSLEEISKIWKDMKKTEPAGKESGPKIPSANGPSPEDDGPRERAKAPKGTPKEGGTPE